VEKRERERLYSVLGIENFLSFSSSFGTVESVERMAQVGKLLCVREVRESEA
jgi:hypothetical protein